jgi:hypothetical protein
MSSLPAKSIWSNADVWGPHYWFFLHTVTLSYPLHPNETTKRKYYDLIQNMPLFIPDPEIANYFCELLDRHPVQPYLDKRDSFVRWMIFMHNHVNAKLGKDELSFQDAMDLYYEKYNPKYEIVQNHFISQKYIAYLGVIFLCFVFVYVTLSDHPLRM